MRAGDTVSRLGGDEFASLQLGVTTPTQASVLAQRIIDHVGEPYELEGHRVLVGVSIGIALAANGNIHPSQLMKNADLALYRAKRDGRGTWRFFEAGDGRAGARHAARWSTTCAAPCRCISLSCTISHS